MFLLGDFTDMETVKVEGQITKEDLIKARDNNSFQVINVTTWEYFYPKLNKWIRIE